MPRILASICTAFIVSALLPKALASDQFLYPAANNTDADRLPVWYSGDSEQLEWTASYDTISLVLCEGSSDIIQLSCPQVIFSA